MTDVTQVVRLRAGILVQLIHRINATNVETINEMDLKDVTMETNLMVKGVIQLVQFLFQLGLAHLEIKHRMTFALKSVVMVSLLELKIVTQEYSSKIGVVNLDVNPVLLLDGTVQILK